MTYPADVNTLTLFTPVTLPDGQTLKELRMREPLVRDRIKFSKLRANQHMTEEEIDAGMIADLCGVELDVIYSLTAADFAQLTDAFTVFMVAPTARAALTKKLSRKG